MFFSEKPTPFGLDMSDLSMKLAWLRKQGGQLHLASFGRTEISENVIEEGIIKKEDVLIDLIKYLIEQVKGEKLKNRYCIVSLPETDSYLRIVQLPKIKKDEIQEAIKWEVEANFPVGLNDVYYDWQIIGEAAGGQTNILIGALPKSLVDPYLDVIKKAGLKPLAFEIESIATARALINEKQNTDPLIIVDIGAKRSSLIIFSGETVWLTTSLSVSNNLFAEDIAKSLKITPAKAKSLKLKYGLDAQKEEGKLYQALEPRLSDLVMEARKYIDYYQATNQVSRNISKIILCGGGANLEGLPAFLSSHLKIEVVIGNPWVNILDSSSKELPKIPFSDSLSYTTALGLALRGINQ